MTTHFFSRAVVAADCVRPNATGYLLTELNTTTLGFSVNASCDVERGYGGHAQVFACESAGQEYVLRGCSGSLCVCVMFTFVLPFGSVRK